MHFIIISFIFFILSCSTINILHITTSPSRFPFFFFLFILLINKKKSILDHFDKKKSNHVPFLAFVVRKWNFFFVFFLFPPDVSVLKKKKRHWLEIIQKQQKNYLLYSFSLFSLLLFYNKKRTCPIVSNSFNTESSHLVSTLEKRK